MKKTILALTATTLLSGLTLGMGSATAATQPGLHMGSAPTTYVAMMSRKQKMMMRKQKMMNKRMMMKKKMM